MTLADLLIEYLATNPRIASTETGRRYRTVTNAITRHLGRPATVADLTADSYGRWVNARREEVAPNTLAGDAEKLLVLWRWASRRGLAIEPTVAAGENPASSNTTKKEATRAPLVGTCGWPPCRSRWSAEQTIRPLCTIRCSARDVRR